VKALAWHGNHDVRVDTVPDPSIEQPTDAIIKITSSGICGSDLHLYEVLGAFIDPGDILGHEPMGIVQEVGSEVKNIAPGDRVVIPFNISCGRSGWRLTAPRSDVSRTSSPAFYPTRSLSR
jgi:threonine dehydrogenase-like Zn-dependent dehydrogenase